MSDQRYNLRGVSASKEDVHNAIKNIDKGIFPQAFCKIIPDILGGDPEYCNIMHADGAGTKSSLAYMYWKETGDLSVWKGVGMKYQPGTIEQRDSKTRLQGLDCPKATPVPLPE
jgi:phosphoribosylformylglycinamidine cyclo-ligase